MQPTDHQRRVASPGRILTIYISESDRFQGKPLHEAIVAKCREMKIAGATVLLGLEGWGETAEMHKARLAGRDRPVVITIADTAENITRLIPAIEPMMDTGLIASGDVEMVRIEKDSS